MKKKSIVPVRQHGELLADPILCSTYAVVKAAEAIAQKRMRLSTNTGVLQFLLSGENTSRGMFDTSAISAKLNNPEGKKVNVRRKFRPIKTTKTLTGGKRNYCAPVDGCANPYKEDVIDLGFDYSEVLTCFNESELRLAGPGELMSTATAEQFARDLIAFENTFAAVVVKRILGGGLVGNFKDGSTIKDLPLYLSNGQALNPSGMVYLHQWLSEVGISDMPALVGGSLVGAYDQVRNVASPNLAGFDPSLSPKITTITDYSVPNVFGDADHALVIVPGALQLFQYNLHQGEFMAQENDPNSRRYLLTSPFTGITWDAFWQRERNCDTGDFEWRITASLIWDVVGLPDCWSDDACMDGVKDVFKVNIVCSDAGVCEIDRSEPCIDAANLPLNPNTMEFPPASVLCAQPARLILNTSHITNGRVHSMSTASTGDAIGVQIGGSTISFDTPITLGDAPGAALLKTALIDAIGSAGVVTRAVFSVTTLVDIVTDDSIAGIELIISGAANIEFTTAQYTNMCRVTSTMRPSTGATNTSLRIVHAAIDTTGAPTAAIAQTDATGYFADFFVFNETPFTFGAAITVTYTDSASQTDTEATILCADV